jgi:phosphoribosylanthranilate isomerase
LTQGESPRVKVCGITRREDAETAAAAGADFLGVILAPGGKRTVSAAAARDLLAGLGVLRVGVFVGSSEAEVLRAAEDAALHVVQLHGDETPETADALRRAGLTVWKALRPRSGEDFADNVGRYASSVDAILLDGWSARAHGGTGAKFPWAEVAPHRHLLPQGVQLVAAGGMRAENVAEAAGLLRPDVVDVSSGVESAPGVKDAGAVRAFVAAVRSLSSTEQR